jgi:hypothetical protein
MNTTNSTAEMNLSEVFFQHLVLAPMPEREFSNDVEAVYECERMMALPGYKQLPLDEQAEVARTREQILQNWQADKSNDFSAPEDDRFLRYKFNLVKNLWAQHQGEPLPEYGRVQFSQR